jgi:hypothetical protein
MRLYKANIAGLTSQQYEMKSILAGTWPPLKPLPVFKYETVEYRATIDFDKRRGEWVCRKTSLPSNKVQELRGGLSEITMALPHGEEEMLIEGTEQHGQELEKDTNRRIQAIHDWRDNYENGAHYFELRDFLSESQRTELDDSLRLSLTARQLQFNAKNVANVFDDLSIAGGRFAMLIEFAKRNKDEQGTGSPAQREGAVVQPGCAERCAGAKDFPALSIKDVFPEQDQGSLAKQMAPTVSQQLEIETSEIVEEDSPLLVEPPREESSHTPAFIGFTAQVRAAQSSAGRIEGSGSSSRFPRLEISAFQVNVFALLFLFAATAFTVGLTVGRGPVGRRLREAPKSLLAADAKPPEPPDQADESTSRTPPPAVASSDDSAGAKRLDDVTPPEEKSKESTRGPEYSPEYSSKDARSTASDSPVAESKPAAKPQVNSEDTGAIAPTVRNVSPPVSSHPTRSPRAAGPIRSTPRSPAPHGLTTTIGAAPHLPRPSTVLVNVPSHGSQPFRVSFPKKVIAATSSFAVTSQLCVLVSPEPGAIVGHKPARLEAGDLVSFVWPRYPRPGDQYGLAETVRVRVTIGQLGQVLEVKFLGGSLSLLPATTGAIRQWSYRPTLLNKRPVQAQEDVTIEFRPPQYSSQMSTQHSSHN